jgi:hypothetical protein
MPRVNPEKLIELLTTIHCSLTIVWEKCKNYELCDILKVELDRIEEMIHIIETL